MAFQATHVLVPTFLDVLDATQLAIDLDLETHKAALFTNAITNDYTADTAYGVAPYNANEIANGGGYTTGGAAVTGTTFTQAVAGRATWDAADVDWAASTITAARGCLIYADALAGNNGIIAVNFGADYSTQNGLFRIQWHADGIWYVPL